VDKAGSEARANRFPTIAHPTPIYPAKILRDTGIRPWSNHLGLPCHSTEHGFHSYEANGKKDAIRAALS
jgi:hypothetical protein